MEEVSLILAIGEFLCVPTLEVFVVHAARLVELDEDV